MQISTALQSTSTTDHFEESSVIPASKQKSPNILYSRPRGELMPMVLNLFLAAGTSNELWRYAPVVVELRFSVPGAALSVNGLLISG